MNFTAEQRVLDFELRVPANARRLACESEGAGAIAEAIVYPRPQLVREASAEPVGIKLEWNRRLSST